MLRVAVSGAGGLLGSHLVRELRRAGHEVRTLVRRPPRTSTEIGYDPAERRLDPADLTWVDAVVHLAGEPIAQRWTAEVKDRIMQSRVDGTWTIASAVAAAAGHAGPRVLVSASAIGFYGDRGDELLTEASPAGTGFTADVVRAWEAAADPARDAGVRVVRPRTGIVLSRRGGALGRMLPLARLGLLGRFGTGEQHWSWISIVDEVHALIHLLTAEVEGPVNLVAPNPVTNRELVRTLGRVLRRPTVLPVPRIGPKLLLGEAADEVLYASQRVSAEKLLASGYRFRHPDLETALRVLLHRRR